MEMDWTYLKERQNQFYLSRLSMDTTGEEEKGRTKITWRRVLETEMAEKVHSWNTIHQLSKDRYKKKRIIWWHMLHRGMKKASVK